MLEVPFLRSFRDKSRRGRLVPLDPDVKRWLATLGRREGAVFVTRRQYHGEDGGRRPRPLRDSRKLLEAIEAAIGVKVNPHDCRRSFAESLRQAGLDTKDIQEVLGHSSVVTTEGYLKLGADYLEKARAAMERARVGGKCPGSVPSARPMAPSQRGENGPVIGSMSENKS